MLDKHNHQSLIKHLKLFFEDKKLPFVSSVTRVLLRYIQKFSDELGVSYQNAWLDIIRTPD
jgi:hypothetical protein